MKRLLAFFCLMSTFALASAQEQTTQLTLFKSFKPAVIHMSSGKDIKHPMANISLRHAALLYLQGSYTMEANMDRITGVEIAGKKFIKLGKQLAECLDTVGTNQLFCVSVIDMPAFEQQQKNNKNITNLDLSSDATSYTTIDLESEDDRTLPLIRVYYYRYNNEIIKVHEREIKRRIDKEKMHMYKSVISLPDFSWVRRESLAQLLKAISD